ncbi:retention module-containing protein, partial [Aurantivibrio plasticivorans]
MADLAAIATVTAITGRAFVKDENGKTRELAVGDILRKGDVIVTEAGSSVELETADGEAIALQEAQEVTVSEDMSSQSASDRQDSEVAESTIETVLQALESNEDLNQVLADTAAGGGAASEGHSFLRLSRILETLETTSLNLSENDTTVAPILDTDAVQGGEANSEDTATPPTTPPGNSNPILGADTSVDVVENTLGVGSFPATDVDSDTIIYSLSGADAALFQIDASGNLSFITAPDFESNPGPFDVTIIATDDGEGNLTASQNITVNVTNVIENTAPVLGSDAIADVPENSSFVGNYAATDADGDNITYTLGGADAALFQIDSNGNLSFITAPDFESNPGPFDVTITATDDGEGNLSATQNITVNVTNVTENTAPLLGTDVTVDVTENTVSVGNYAATDAEGDNITYSLSGADAALFEIDTSGNLRFISPPDFETDPGPFNVIVTATDDGEGSLSASQNIIVNIQDASENGPTITVTASDVTEESVAVGDVIASFTAADPDGDVLTYQLLNNSDNYFVLNGTDVELTADGVAAINDDALNLTSLTIEVEASDGTNTASDSD